VNKKTTGSVKCGWCMTGDHEDCKTQITYLDKIWLCSCTECHPDREKEKVEETTSED
jgi:hypothetical protein